MDHIGKKIVNTSLQNAADQHGKALFIREPNEKSYQFIAKGYPTKPRDIKAKTAETGLVAGLVPVDPRFSKIHNDPHLVEKYQHSNNELLEAKNTEFKKAYHSKEVDGQTHFASYKEKTDPHGNTYLDQKWKTTKQLENEKGGWKKIEVMGKDVKDSSGHTATLPITGDVDIAFEAHPVQHKLSKSSFDLNNDPAQGMITPHEVKLSDSINQHARRMSSQNQQIVNHGFHAHDPSGSELTDKVKVYKPGSKSPKPETVSPEQLKSYMKENLPEYRKVQITNPALKKHLGSAIDLNSVEE